MNSKRRSSLVGGLVLILLGAAFLAVQLVPGLRFWFSWPWIIIGVGAFLLVFGLLVGAPGMAVPACIVGGIGGLLAWQEATGQWDSWIYAWTLIPGFVGLGVILSGLLEGKVRQALRDGGVLVLISLMAFTIFGSLFGRLGILGPYWPVLLILWGLVLLVRSLFRPH